jgi:hypothetical protein
MNPPHARTAGADPDAAPQAPRDPCVPRYRKSSCWRAYVHLRAVQAFEREWLVNAILWSRCARVRDHALQALLSCCTSSPMPCGGLRWPRRCVS